MTRAGGGSAADHVRGRVASLHTDGTHISSLANCLSASRRMLDTGIYVSVCCVMCAAVQVSCVNVCIERSINMRLIVSCIQHFLYAGEHTV